MNVLLIMVDCLRYDYVVPEYMPWLRAFADNNVEFTNYWSSSHCTDPAFTHMLSGKHPDALGLYSMMYEHKDYTIPDDVEMIAQYAKKRGYSTGFITNVGRWYRRGVDRFIDSRGWPGVDVFRAGEMMIKTLQEPWWACVHTDDMHKEYTGGSYQAAARCVDGYIANMLRDIDYANTKVIITADHGEGLGDKGIIQHGFGLWDFLTHVPLIVSTTNKPFRNKWIAGPGKIREMMWFRIYMDTGGELIGGYDPLMVKYVFQAGDTPPNHRHRGIVGPCGQQYIKHARGNITMSTSTIGEWGDVNPSDLLADHCSRYGIDYYGESMDKEVVDRLKGLGYFD